MIRRPPRSTLFPTRRSSDLEWRARRCCRTRRIQQSQGAGVLLQDRKSTRLNSSHGYISYAVFCLKKKKTDSRKVLVYLQWTNMPWGLWCMGGDTVLWDGIAT